MHSRRRTAALGSSQSPTPVPGERTGKHKCVRCLAEIPSEEYFRNDFFCDKCAVNEFGDADRQSTDAPASE